MEYEAISFCIFGWDVRGFRDIRNFPFHRFDFIVYSSGFTVDMWQSHQANIRTGYNALSYNE